MVEILVVVSIIGLMSIIGLASLRGTRSSGRIKAAQREVATVIKLAQSYALQGKTQNIPSLGGQVAPCGYGVHFRADKMNYDIFYNYPAAGTSCGAFNGLGVDSKKFRIAPLAPVSGTAESFSLKNGVTLSSPVTATDAAMYFTIPFAGRFDKDGNSPSSGQTQVFTFSFSGASKSITISQGGDITEEK